MAKITESVVLHNIMANLEKKNMTQADFIKAVNERLPENKRIKTRSTFSDWKSGKSKSYMKIISPIAEVLDVSVSELYGEPVDGYARIAVKNNTEREILKLYRSATPTTRAFIAEILEKSNTHEGEIISPEGNRVPVKPVPTRARYSVSKKGPRQRVAVGKKKG